jgi:murein hydrolase activator
MRTGRIVIVVLSLLSCTMLPFKATGAAQPDRKRTEASLRSVTERIERIQRQVQQDAVEKDRINRDLREAERAVASAQGQLAKIRAERQLRSAERARLAAERLEREAERTRTQSDLATQLRTAYFMGRNEPLKLLLNQRNPAEFGRNLAYYGYFGRLRAQQVGLINDNIRQIEEIAAKIEEEDAKLAELEQANKGRVVDLQSARRQRGRVLASLERESKGRSATLERLQGQRSQLEHLLKELSRATEAVPFDPNDAFAKLRGKLSWPIAGRLETAFGEQIVGGLRSNGLEIAADRGTNVKAVHEGRVVFADWLPGRGLLIILDHGNGYLSLYGHNEQLFKQAGSTVKAGDAIATAGDSGGRNRPGLYFEIRHSGKPVDPRGWFKTSSPPGG